MNNKTKIVVTTYEEDRLNYFTKLMTNAQNKYKRLFKKFKDFSVLSPEYEVLCDAGRETQFHGDVVEMLEKAACRQSEAKLERIFEFGERCWLGYCSACGIEHRGTSELDLKLNHRYCYNCGEKLKGGE